ncbi:MAG: TolC family protein [Rhodothermales bacterium]|nr:TolC family protein [Rhodothermales bacterium]
MARRSAVLLFCLLGLVSSAVAQVDGPEAIRISLSEALGFAALQNPAILEAGAAVREMEGLARQSGAFRNPSLMVSHEPSWRDGDGYSETYLTLSQRLGRIGERRARQSEAQNLAAASRAAFLADSLDLTFQVGLAYLKAASAEQRVDALAKMVDAFRLSDETMREQLAEGEISGYSRRRLLVERARYTLELARAQLAVRDARRGLTRLIAPANSGSTYAPIRIEWEIPEVQTVEAYLKLAFSRRPVLDAARLEVSAAEAGLQIARVTPRPDPTLTAGYKSQSDGFDGIVLGLSTPLPLVNRNRGATEAARMRLLAAEIRADAARYRIETEVRGAYDALVSAHAVFGELVDGALRDAGDLMTTAEAGYLEGEMSLLELLDAAQSTWVQQDLIIDLRASRLEAYLELLRTIGAGPDTFQ